MKKPETELINPVHDLINGNMHGLPQIIQNSMPTELPQLTFDQSTISLFFGNMKIKQLTKAKKGEAELARYTREQVLDKLTVIDALVTFSGGVADKLGAFEHNKDMRRIEVQKGYAELKNLELAAKEKEANIQQINYQTALIAQEVEAVKLDNKIKFKNAREILGEEEK